MVKPFRNLHRLPKTIDDFSDLVVSKQKGRYVITDKSGELLDTAQGWGYKTHEKAMAYLEAKYKQHVIPTSQAPDKKTKISASKDEKIKTWHNYLQTEFPDLISNREINYADIINHIGVLEDFLQLGIGDQRNVLEGMLHTGAIRSRVNKHEKQSRDQAQAVDFEKIKLTKDQQKAVDLIKEGKNVFVSGSAGTGKSLLLKYIIHKFADNHTRICAPIGLAAVNVHGTTIHRLLRLNIAVDTLHEKPYRMPKSLKGAYRVIADEISMVRSDLFRWLSICLRKAEKLNKHPIQLIVVGDFYQLAPVVRRGYERKYFGKDGEYCFTTKDWQSWHFQPVLLHEVVRQKDPKFIDALNRIRIGDTSGIDYFNNYSASHELQHAVTLTSKNATANAINTEKLKKLSSKIHTFLASSRGMVSNGEKPVADEIKLKKGAQVIAMSNGEGYENGSIGNVVGFTKNDSNDPCVLVRFEENNETKLVEPKTWHIYAYEKKMSGKKGEGEYVKAEIGRYSQIPLRLGYAITIHKSQGQTYDRVNVQPAGWSSGLLYVSLSRATKISNMYLSHRLWPGLVKVSSAVKNFYNEIEKQ
ncbi:ATP-dependent DNA helicase [Lactobacillus crispatus]|uniref:DEAD/DEAH box helicase n=2 Tax=Lactobacillus crispatus TaxID=47770 RepID=A0AAW8WSA1_9LACO|nr:DEAD/DEAH box helicase [Lactobacillus crispatus]MDT9609949.1 DEAD/DEAH box helicase [Lactobacillus crispatus]MDT9617550.1 DEAD/DEAH box helicase [Lactobacillus crispatus]